MMTSDSDFGSERRPSEVESTRRCQIVTDRIVRYILWLGAISEAESAQLRKAVRAQPPAVESFELLAPDTVH